MPARLRRFVFWAHLGFGISAGLVILIMCVTGALLALQPQILGVLERDVRRVEPIPGTQRLGPRSILQSAMAAKPDVRPASVVLEADPSASAVVAFGRDGNIFINPYTGAVLGSGAIRARRFFRALTDWHRYLGAGEAARSTARAITGASNAVFLALAVSGLFLWCPLTLGGIRRRPITRLDLGLTGKARDFNWHNAIGFYSAPILIVLTVTGLVLSYPWANRLVYRLSGSPIPVAGPVSSAPPTGSDTPGSLPGNLDVLWARAEQMAPTWGTMTMRLGSHSGAPIAFSVTDARYWNAFARSNLTLDARSGEVVRWEPYTSASRGQKLRGWIRFAHTGELGGAMAQSAAGLACIGGALLVWTGWSLAARRLMRWRRATPNVTARAA